MATIDDDAAIARLLDRLAFGADATRLARARHDGWDASVRTLLAPAPSAVPQSLPGPPLLALIDRPGKGAAAAARQAANRERRAQQAELVLWWLDRMVAAEPGATERMTWFWHGHFATSLQKVKSASLMLGQNETLRRLCTGTFSELAHAMIVDPAMLVWLDGNDNKIGAANENLAREFMELFTLGHGSFTEDDVRAAARALTGWKVNRHTGKARFVQRQHDDAPKALLGSTSDLDAPGFVDRVLGQPASPVFVISRVWLRLVGTTPTPAALTRLRRAYGSSGDLTALLHALVAEPGFRDDEAAVVKQPVEWLVGLMRALGVRPSTLDERTKLKLLVGLRGMGQLPFLPPSVGGWPAGGAWLTTSAALARTHTATVVAGKANLRALAATSHSTRTTAVARALGLDGISSRTRAALDGAADNPVALVAAAACCPEFVVSR